MSLTPGIGGVTTRKLMERYGGVELIFHASPEEIAAIPRISLSTTQKLLNSPIEQLEAELRHSTMKKLISYLGMTLGTPPIYALFTVHPLKRNQMVLEIYLSYAVDYLKNLFS